MQYTSIFLATLALVSAMPMPMSSATEQDMSGAQGSVTNSRQVQDTLNRQLQANGGAHANQARVNAFITGADSQIDNTIATVSDALAPLTMGASKAIGNVLLGPFVQSVTNGAEVLLSNLIGGGEDLADAQMTASLTGNYAKLSALAAKNNVDASKLQNLSQQITNTVSDKSKRDDGGMSGIKGAMTNLKQTVDTMKQNMQDRKGTSARDTIDAFITGADSQIDNAAATISQGLNGVTLGISGKIGDFLLGPFVQSVTNGAEVMISNVVGGSVDIVSDGTAKLFSESLSKLHSLAVKNNVNSNDTEALAKTQKQVKELKAPKKDKKEKNHDKRATDSDMSGVNGSVTNARQVQDTLNRDLSSHQGHFAQDEINAFITGTDSQIDNSIATVSDALAPFTLGLSKDIGNVLLGPFVQSVTNGAEVFVSNVIGGGIDGAAGASIDLYNNSLARLSSLATSYNIDTSKLDSVRQQIAGGKSKSH